MRAHYDRHPAYVAPYGGYKKRPPSRLLRDHRKLVAATDKALRAGKHRLFKGWKYWHGQSIARCIECHEYFRIRLDAKSFNVTPCHGRYEDESASGPE